MLAPNGTTQENPLRVLPRLADDHEGELPQTTFLQLTYDAQGNLLDRRDVNPFVENIGTMLCYDNSNLGTCISQIPFTVADPGTELLDWGFKSSACTGKVSTLAFAYRTGALDPSVGGPGASFGVSVRRGTTGFNNNGTEIYRQVFTGMPGSLTTFPYSPVVVVKIDFSPTPLTLPNGPIGWSYLQLDGQTGPVLVEAPDLVLGTQDALDVFKPGPIAPNSYTGTFNFASQPCKPAECCPYGSLWFQVGTIENQEATSTVQPGSGINPLVFNEVLPAVMGQNWVGQVDLTNFPFAQATYLLSSRATQPTALTPFGELWVDTSQPVIAPQIGLGLHIVAVPVSLELVGTLIHTQAVIEMPGQTFQLTNGLDVTMGL